MAKRIGLVGVGLVGAALAENLIRAGYHVHGFDINPERMRVLEDTGGVCAESAAAVGDTCETVLLSVRDSDAVCDAVEGPEGLLSGTPAVRYVMDTTTGDPDRTIALAGRLAERGIAYLDATISGSSEQIRQRMGVFLVGGREEHYRACRTVIDELSREHHYLGPPGSGAKTKLASNLILGLNRLALAEGLVFAERLGLELSSFLEVLRNTPAYSAAIDVKGEKMLSGDFTPQSKISQHRKDLDIILTYGKKHGQPLPLSEAHHRILTRAEEDGMADADTCAVIEELRRMHGNG